MHVDVSFRNIAAIACSLAHPPLQLVHAINACLQHLSRTVMEHQCTLQASDNDEQNEEWHWAKLCTLHPDLHLLGVHLHDWSV